MTDPARVRAFFAVPPDPGWVATARGLVSRLRPASPDASWTRPESWHVTLRFLGEIPVEKTTSFADAIAPAAEGMPAGDLRSGGAVVFPDRGPARVLGVGFEPGGGAEALSRLAAKAELCAREIGLEPETRPWRPHVTLARIRRKWPPAQVDRFREEVARSRFPLWPLRRCVLFQSRLEREGAVHMPIREWPLRPAEGRTA